jgi:hypothetical protein
MWLEPVRQNASCVSCWCSSPTRNVPYDWDLCDTPDPLNSEAPLDSDFSTLACYSRSPWPGLPPTTDADVRTNNLSSASRRWPIRSADVGDCVECKDLIGSSCPCSYDSRCLVPQASGSYLQEIYHWWLPTLVIDLFSLESLIQC